MRDQDLDVVLDRIASWVPRFHDEPSVSEVAEQTNDPFLILVATLISLRTREEVTRVAAPRLFALARTPAALASLPLETIERAITPATFAGAKARTLRDVAATLVNQHDGRVPDTLEGLLSLKGVGRKTANLVLTRGFHQPGICVDIHVHRIFNRLGYVQTRSPDETEQVLRGKLPARYWIPVNGWLVTFGRNQCLPISPRCTTCPVRQHCDRVGVTRFR